MSETTLKRVSEECQKLIDRIKALEEIHKTQPWSNPVECGAIKRTSMDLTRLLADLRAGREPRP